MLWQLEEIHACTQECLDIIGRLLKERPDNPLDWFDGVAELLRYQARVVVAAGQAESIRRQQSKRVVAARRREQRKRAT